MKLLLFSVARHLQRVQGTKCAAAYLRRNGISIEATMWCLLRKETRDHL